MSVERWRFAQNSATGGGCGHEQIALMNDETPTIQCSRCGKRWSLVPSGVEPIYCAANDATYPGMLDNRGWPISHRDVRIAMKKVDRS